MEARGGNRFLLTCAMTRYEHCAEWDREELREDVARMVRLFCGDFLPEAGRYTHADVLGESPTSVELKDRLRDFFLSTDRHPDDYVVVYFTGHGEILDDGDHVLLTNDTSPSDLLNRTVPAGEIVKLALANTRVRRLLLFLDTCYSGRGGEEMTREALRRIDDPGKRSDDQVETSEGGGIVVVAATQPYQRALPGTFTSCLDRAARSLAVAGNAPQTLRVGALMGAVVSDLERPTSQTSVWYQVGITGDEPSFILNPRYRPGLVDVDLLEQERARYAEQRADSLRDRFLPATRWFTGRHAALTDLAAWLGNPADSRALVVTGQAGSGKTALLGLFAALSDPDQAPAVPRDGLPPGLTIADGAITEAIYAGTMTIGQIRDRIAVAAGLRVDTTAELIDGLRRSEVGPITVLVDALDEAADPRGLVSGLLEPLMREHRGALRFLLGTRPHLLSAKLLGKPEARRYLQVDLDSGQYADPASIRTYVRRILLSEDPLDSAYKPSGLYQTVPAGTLDAVTEAIGEAAGASFLVARITAVTEATTTKLPNPTDPGWRQALPRHAGPAMRRDLRLRLGSDADKAARLLLPLAYAQGSGLPWEDIWPRVAAALSPGYGYGNDDLIWLRKAAGSYAVESPADDDRSAYRLYHKALADNLLEDRDQLADQQAITRTLTSLVPAGIGGTKDWRGAHPYIRAHLASHAAQAESIDELLADPAYLLTASRPPLLAAADAACSKSARAAADAYRRAAHHLRIAPEQQHASYLQLAARCARAPQLADALETCRQHATWSCTWASWRLEPNHRAFIGHDGPVYTVAAAELEGRPVVISGSDDRTIRVWDLATGAPIGAPFTGHTGHVYAIAAELKDRPVVISGSNDGTVRVWDLASGTPMHDPVTVYTGPEYSVAAAELEGRPVIISGSDDGTVQVWDLAGGDRTDDPSIGHSGPVYAMAAAELEGRPVVISGSEDCTVRVWDLATGDPVGDPFTGHTGWVYTVAAAELEGRPVVISGADDGTVRVWDLATGDPVGDPSARHTGPVYTVAAAELQGRPVVISGGGDQSVRVWDIAKRRPLRYHFRRVRLRHAAPVRAAVPMREDRLNVITGCRDSVSQTWDLSAGRLLSRITTPGRAGVSAIVTLAPDRILYANGGMLSLYKGTNNAAPALTIDLDSQIHALIAHGSSTVVAATRLGVVALRIPY